jgi:meso-butanediol dehydrogenase / (S,S)-butanediol dehydrogenase / diacetyl reductase
MNARFTGTTVLVTGGGTGIGRAIALAFADEGATVMITGRTLNTLHAVAAERPAGVIHTFVGDVGDGEQAEAMVAAAVGINGRLNVLVNNAAIGPSQSVLEIEPASWREVIDINLNGPFYTSRVAAQHMVAMGGGSIINVASICSFLADSPHAHYNTSKAGLTMLTKCFAYELGHLGVRCNAIAPGLTATPLVAEQMESEDFRVAYTSRIPVRRLATPQEQAGVVLFLASDAAAFITGETIVVDGGMLAGSWWLDELKPPVPARD